MNMFSNGKLIISVVIFSLFGGCALTREKPLQAKVAVPVAWQSSAADRTAWPDREWWKRFQDSELDALITEAQNSNHDLKAAAARIAQARATAGIVGTALYPSVTLAADVTRTKSAGKGPENKFGVGPKASYEIDLWGANREASAAAEAAVLSSTYGHEVVRLALISDVANTYFQILSLNDRIEVAMRNLANARKLLDVVEAQSRAGKFSPFEVERQKTQVANMEATIPPLLQQSQIARNALAVLLGKNPGEGDASTPSLRSLAAPAVATGPTSQLVIRSPGISRVEADLSAGNDDGGASRDALFPRLTLALMLNKNPGDTSMPSLRSLDTPAVPMGLPSQLLERRPDIRRAEADLIAAHANVAAARAALFPRLTLGLQGGFESSVLHSILNSGTGIYSITLELLATIFDGGKRSGQVDLAAARRTELVESYQQSIISGFRDVEDALVSVQQFTDQEKAHLEEMNHAREAYRLAAVRLRAGAVDFTALLDAERVLLSAETARDQARIGRFSALVNLYRALGGGWS